MWIIRAADSSALDAALDRLDEDTTISVWPQEEPARAAAQRMSTPEHAWYAQRLVDLFLEAMQEAEVGHGRCKEALRQLGSCLGGHAQPAPPPPAEAPAVAPDKLNWALAKGGKRVLNIMDNTGRVERWQITGHLNPEYEATRVGGRDA